MVAGLKMGHLQSMQCGMRAMALQKLEIEMLCRQDFDRIRSWRVAVLHRGTFSN
jgi:hypothetical protein